MSRQSTYQASNRMGTRGEIFPKARNGFTLIELLVVVAIIAILIGVLLPSLSAARAEGRRAVCLTHEMEMGKAAQLFTADHGGRIQLVTDDVGLNKYESNLSENVVFDQIGELLVWPAALANVQAKQFIQNYDWGVRALSFQDAQSKEQNILHTDPMSVCPADSVQLSTCYYPRNQDSNHNGLIGPGTTTAPIDTSYWGRLSYGLNEDIAGAEVHRSGDGTRNACWRAVEYRDGWMECAGQGGYSPTHPCGDRNFGKRLQGKIDRVDTPSSVALFVEAGPDSLSDDDTTQDFANLVGSFRASLDRKYGPYLSDFQQQLSSRLPTERHPRQHMNILFVDLHGESIHPIAETKLDSTSQPIPSEYEPRVRVSPYPVHKVTYTDTGAAIPPSP